MTERFTRTGPDTIVYRFTMEDPTTFTAPFTGELPFTRIDEMVYEYACHEGNYAMTNILSGERLAEQGGGVSQQRYILALCTPSRSPPRGRAPPAAASSCIMPHAAIIELRPSVRR